MSQLSTACDLGDCVEVACVGIVVPLTPGALACEDVVAATEHSAVSDVQCILADIEDDGLCACIVGVLHELEGHDFVALQAFQVGLTLIVFSSDNGYSCGHHGFWHKGNGTFPLNMYENSVKVPFIMSHPGKIPEGRVSEAMVSQYDFMPTLLDYLGLPDPNDDMSPGKSFVPALTRKTDDAQDEVVVFDEYGPVRMIRTQEWKYVHRYPYGPHELYDLAKDPNERKNLIDNKSQKALISDMRRQMGAWFERYVDPRLDGTRCAVTGRGQKAKIGDGMYGEDAFNPRYAPSQGNA